MVNALGLKSESCYEFAFSCFRFFALIDRALDFIRDFKRIRGKCPQTFRCFYSSAARDTNPCLACIVIEKTEDEFFHRVYFLALA